MPVRNLLEGRAALIVIDIQAATFTDNREGDADSCGHARATGSAKVFVN